MSNLSFKTVDSKNKKRVVGISVVVLLVVGVIFFLTRNTHSTGDDGVFKNQVIDNLSFENGDLEVTNGTSTITVDVYNDTDSDYALSTIDVVVTLEDNSKETLTGYVGDKIKTHEAKVLSVSIDKDLSSIKSIEYIVRK